MCRVIGFYGMGYREVMNLPVRAFWTLNAHIDRLRAEQELRLVEVMAGAQSEENYRSLVERLTRERGDPVKLKATAKRLHERDEAGFQMLKAMAGM